MKLNKDTVLQDMFELQKSLQKNITEKRQVFLMDDSKNRYEKAVDSGYFFMCTVVELNEMLEEVEKLEGSNDPKILENVKFEVIDVWHFLMCQLIYLGYTLDKDIEYYYEQAVIKRRLTIDKHVDMTFNVSEFISSIGKMYNNTSYKCWKNYNGDYIENDDLLIDLIDDVVISFFTFFVILEMDIDEIWKYYVEKNKENLERQNIGGRYAD